jgi:hypothetical protein
MSVSSELDKVAIVNYLRRCTVLPELDNELRKWLRSNDTEIRTAAISAIGNASRLSKKRWAVNALIRAGKPGNPPEVIAEAKKALSLMRPNLYSAHEQAAVL